jgi:hypothetical protein
MEYWPTSYGSGTLSLVSRNHSLLPSLNWCSMTWLTRFELPVCVYVTAMVNSETLSASSVVIPVTLT